MSSGLDSRGRILRLGWVLAALLPAVAVGIPAQWLALRYGFNYQRYLPVWFHRYVAFVFRLRVLQKGRPVPQRPLLIVSNHVSWLDITVLSTALPVSFIAKSEVAGWPLFGLFSRLQRSIFVDRSRRAATAAVNTEIAARLRDGDPIVLFAEGTTGDGNRVLPFRSALIGAAGGTLGADAVTIQPLSVAYTRRSGLPAGRADQAGIAWYGAMDLAPHLATTLCGGPIDALLSWGEPLVFAAGSDRKDVSRRLRDEVRRLSAEARSGRAPLA